MKVLHVIPALGQGGAERLASELTSRTPDDIEHVFVSMTDDAPFFPMDHIRIESLGLKRGQISPKAALSFRSLAKREQPALVQGWLYHGNILASFARGLGAPIVWSIHNTNLDARGSRRMTRFLNRLAAMTSPFIPERIVYCAEESRKTHELLGYDSAKGVVIRNGVDLERFKASGSTRARQREMLGVASTDILLGQFGRLDAQKGVPTLLAAFERVRQRFPAARLALAGSGLEPSNADLVALVRKSDLQDQVFLLGARTDIPDLLCALDILVIASLFGEALPMIALEAAASGLPLVTTDIGEAKLLALSPQHVVPADDPSALADAVCRICRSLSGSEFAAAVESRHVELMTNHDIRHTAKAYADLYRSLVHAPDPS